MTPIAVESSTVRIRGEQEKKTQKKANRQPECKPGEEMSRTSTGIMGGDIAPSTASCQTRRMLGSLGNPSS
jgi:hypothetical protein